MKTPIQTIKDILIVLGVGSAVIESQTTQIIYSPLEYLCNPMYLNPYYWKAKKLIEEKQLTNSEGKE